ncbi:MAG TPA: hypothetical protein VF829_00510 [Candidatus Paceibacterota bacterium]
MRKSQETTPQKTLTLFSPKERKALIKDSKEVIRKRNGDPVD